MLKVKLESVAKRKTYIIHTEVVQIAQYDNGLIQDLKRNGDRYIPCFFSIRTGYAVFSAR